MSYIVVMPPLRGGMVLLQHDGNRACPQGVLFCCTGDYPDPTVFSDTEKAQAAIDGSMAWRAEQYGSVQDPSGFAIMPWAPEPAPVKPGPKPARRKVVPAPKLDQDARLDGPTMPYSGRRWPGLLITREGARFVASGPTWEARHALKACGLQWDGEQWYTEDESLAQAAHDALLFAPSEPQSFEELPRALAQDEPQMPWETGNP